MEDCPSASPTSTPPRSKTPIISSSKRRCPEVHPQHHSMQHPQQQWGSTHSTIPPWGSPNSTTPQ